MGAPDDFRGCPDVTLPSLNMIAKKPSPSSLLPVGQWPSGEGLNAISLFKKQGAGPRGNGPQDPSLPQATGSARSNNIILFQL